MNLKSEIVAVHLLNDFSGSPLVFSQALEGLQAAGHSITIYTSSNKAGFLDNVQGERISFPYKFFKNPIIRLFAFIGSQIALFFMLLRYWRKPIIIYINTILPFGAALAGFIMRKKVVYHLHESYIKPRILKSFLKRVASLTANDVIYVSNYLSESEYLCGVKSQIIFNALPDEFVSNASSFNYHPVTQNNFMVLMVCSLKEYKGINEFLELAKRHPSLKFEMVVNANQVEVDSWINNRNVPGNLIIHLAQKNLHNFYCRASLVVNLTNPELCIETFGMTILEAMCYGIPVIAPPVGGPAELVIDGENGYQVDVRNADKLDYLITSLAQHPNECVQLSRRAKATSTHFSSALLKQKITDVINAYN